MCFGGGGKAAKAATAAEEQRRREIAAAQKRIEGIFGSPQREADITDLENATRSFLNEDLGRQKGDADRELKFALARSGLSKGSADVDQNLRLGDDFLRGVQEVERRSKTAGATLRSQDQETKNNLFSQILGGLDATTAAEQAGHSLQQNIALSKSQAQQQGLNDVFGDFSDIFKSSKTAAGDRTARYDFNALYGPRTRPPATIAGGVYGS